MPQSLYANQTVPTPTTSTPQQSAPFLTSAPPHHISPYTNPQRSSASNPSFQSPMAAPPVRHSPQRFPSKPSKRRRKLPQAPGPNRNPNHSRHSHRARKRANESASRSS